MRTIKEKQPEVIEYLSKSIEKKQLVHAYLFEGDRGTGKKATAIWLAQSLFCLEGPIACGHCLNCQRIAEGNHPDVHLIEPDGQSIKLDQMAAVKQHFEKSGLEQAGQFLIVDQAEKMTVQAANSLLKFIEEPSGQLEIVFLTKNREQVLPTIQSRCQHLFFKPVSKQWVKDSLLEQGISARTSELLAMFTQDEETALALSENEEFNQLREVIEKWIQYLVKKDWFAFVYVQQQIIKVCREKEVQGQCYDLLLAVFQLLLDKNPQYQVEKMEGWSQKRLGKVLEEVLASKLRWQSNVSFQNTLEQLALKILSK